jgi:hypothetical protein
MPQSESEHHVQCALLRGDGGRQKPPLFDGIDAAVKKPFAAIVTPDVRRGLA